MVGCRPFVLRGLRLLPWLLVAKRRNPDSVALLFDCDRCQETQTEATRRHLGCGYLAPDEDSKLPVVPWDHPGRVRHADERDEHGRLHLPVCPGYVCGLPEVIEASWAHSYWEKGELAQFCGCEPATPMLKKALEVFACESANASEWESKNPVKQ